MKMREKKEKLYGVWFKGNAFSMPLAEFKKIDKYEAGVKKPTALMTNKSKTKTRFYYKPIQAGEFWD